LVSRSVSGSATPAAGDLEGAQREVDEAIKNWPFAGFHMQDMAALFTQIHIYLYSRNGAAAWDHIRQQWPALEKSLQLKNQMARGLMRDLRARSALAAAASSAALGAAAETESLLAAALDDARRLRRERVGWANTLADRIVACAHAIRGDNDQAVALLRPVATQFEELGCRLQTAAARQSLFRRTSGQESAAAAAAAATIFQQQHIQEPDRMTAIYFPGAM